MKNPLYRRLPRELRSDKGKYIVLFLFLTLTIALVSGFLVAADSVKSAWDESFEKYNVEDGHFTLSSEADTEQLEAIEKEGVSVYELFCKDKVIENEHTIRIYKPREKVNRADLMEGRLPETDDEIVIDRLYAENNGIKTGDTLTIDTKNFMVCGYVALSDYSALYKNNTDMMFDANSFSIALVTEEGFDSLDDAGLSYVYAWKNDTEITDETKLKEFSDELKVKIASQAELTDFVARADNQAIMFTGEDMGGDKIFIQWLLYIVMVIIAFAFAVTTRSTVEQEASVIGTLRASGYTRTELLGHYLALPVLVTAAAAVIGNIIGYAFIKDLFAQVYYHSYSLTTYVTRWNAEAFVLTTVIPLIILFVINVLVIVSALSLSPLQFLRHDLKRKKNKRAVRLPGWKFLTRFRVRIILQNRSAYLTLFAGILFANILLFFGMMFTPLLKKFKVEVQNSKIAEYQYILKTPLPTETEGAEQYSVYALIDESEEEITVYGIAEDTEYLDDIEWPEDGVVLSDGYMEKYGIEIGDRLILSEKYEDKEYSLTVKGSYHYPATMAVFMPIELFNELFDYPDEYFSGYFTDKKLTDIDEIYVASLITEHDLTVMADQLEDSMGLMFVVFCGFAVIMFVLIIYLLAKLIIEKNTYAISMLKILGYSDREAGKLYNNATMIVTLLSMLLSIPICNAVMRGIYYAMMKEYPGWLTYYIAPWIAPVMFAVGVICYFAVHFIEMRKIRRIPMTQALKNME